MNKFVFQCAGLVLLSASIALAEDKVPLKTDLPKPLLRGTPIPVNLPKFEPKLEKWPVFPVPTGTINLASKKKVTASDNDPMIGTLDLVTDGDKSGEEGCWVELAPGKQWVQIDLEKSASIYAVVVWHYHSQEGRVYHDVLAQVSDDPKFEKDVTTIFNADYENHFGFGAGKDLPYVEGYLGKLMDAKGVKGRYVRLYSKGNTMNKLNHYIEVEVFGIPAA